MIMYPGYLNQGYRLQLQFLHSTKKNNIPFSMTTNFTGKMNEVKLLGNNEWVIKRFK
jgi:hypothetical protein